MNLRKIFSGILFLFVSWKPLFSIESGNDSTLQIIRMWHINASGDSLPEPIDTTPDLLHIYHPVYQKEITSTWLGYTGSPFQSNSWFSRPPVPHFFFNAFLDGYMRTPEKTTYYNTRKPFSSFFYVMNTNKQRREEVLHFLHTQNINKDWNFGFTIDIYSTNGLYLWQKSGVHTLSFFSSLNKRHYFYYLSVNYNNFKRQENGGLRYDSVLKTIETGTLSMPVMMSRTQEALSRNRNFSFSYRHGYKFPSLVQLFRKDSGELKSSLSHLIRYDWNKRFYGDHYNDADTFFYRTRLFSSVADSVRNHHLTNELQLSLGNFLYFFTLQTAAIYEINTFQFYTNYSPLSFTDTTYHTYSADMITSGSARLSLSPSRQQSVQWRFTGQQYLTGYQAGDVRYHLETVTRLTSRNDRIEVYATEEHLTPAYGLNHFISSRYRWNNDFSKTNILKLGGAIVSESWKVRLEGHYSLMSRWVYFNEQAIPDQLQVPASILSIKAEKWFAWWKLKSFTRLLYQITDRNDVIHLPAFSGSESLYFSERIRFKSTGGTMLLQSGMDIFYHSLFYADAYIPATSVFYLQHEVKTGNYPFIDFFVNMQVKNVTFFFMTNHIFYPLLGYNYFTAPHYASGQREFKIGLRWLFYD